VASEASVTSLRAFANLLRAFTTSLRAFVAKGEDFAVGDSCPPKIKKKKNKEKVF